jgi:hypothetical protein
MTVVRETGGAVDEIAREEIKWFLLLHSRWKTVCPELRLLYHLASLVISGREYISLDGGNWHKS